MTAVQRAERNAMERMRRGEFNAAQFDRAAGDVLTQAQLEEGQTRTRGGMILGQQRAGFSASGVELEGSALEVLGFQARQNEMEALAVRSRGNAAMFDLQARANVERLESFYDAATGLMDVRADAAAELNDARMDAVAMRYDASVRANATRMGGQAQSAAFTSQARNLQTQASAASSAGYMRAGEAVFNFLGSERGQQSLKRVGSWFG